MTIKEKVDKVAYAVGWTLKERWKWTPPPNWWATSSFAKSYREDRESGILAPPDYANNLEAIYEAVATLSEAQRYYYMENLHDICGAESPHDNPNFDYGENFVVAHATAAQRFEAFGKTLELW